MPILKTCLLLLQYQEQIKHPNKTSNLILMVEPYAKDCFMIHNTILQLMLAFMSMLHFVYDSKTTY